MGIALAPFLNFITKVNNYSFVPNKQSYSQLLGPGFEKSFANWAQLSRFSGRGQQIILSQYIVLY